MSLTTPEAIRTLQRKLYGKAKTEPGYRFYLLHDKVWRADILRHAYELARANKGAPGVDGATFDQIEAAGLEDWLLRLGEELRAQTYRCQPPAFAGQALRRMMIPKPGGGERPLGIPGRGCHVRFQWFRTQNSIRFFFPVAVSDAGMRGGGRGTERQLIML